LRLPLPRIFAARRRSDGRRIVIIESFDMAQPRTRTREAASKQSLKDMVLQALDEAGGVEYLVQRANETPGLFLTLVGKVMPMQVATEHKGEVIAKVVFKGLND